LEQKALVFKVFNLLKVLYNVVRIRLTTIFQSQRHQLIIFIEIRGPVIKTPAFRSG